MKTDTEHIIALISTIRDRSNRLITGELKRRGITDLSPSHGHILQLLYHEQGGVTMQSIAKRINRDKSTVTALVDKLLKLGYVRKAKDPQDSRVTLLFLEEKGEALREDFDAISHGLIETVYRGFEQHEKEELVHALEKIKNNI